MSRPNSGTTGQNSGSGGGTTQDRRRPYGSNHGRGRPNRSRGGGGGRGGEGGGRGGRGGGRGRWNNGNGGGEREMEEEDMNNDVTFGVGLGELEGEFDFTSSSQIGFEKEKHLNHPQLHHQTTGPPGLAHPYGPPHHGEPDWNSYHGDHQTYQPEYGFHSNQNYIYDPLNPDHAGTNTTNPRMLSLEEVEAQLRDRLYLQENVPTSYQVEEIDWDQVRMERRQARELRNAKNHQFKGLMIQSDKNFITRIQLSQLVTSSQSLTLEDYYYRTFMTLNLNNLSEPDKFSDGNGRGPHQNKGRNKENQIARMQRQITKIVAESRRRQLTYPVGLENALGKVTSKSTRNPKQVLQILQQKPDGEDGTETKNKADITALPQPSDDPSRSRIPGLGSMIQTPREKKRTIKLIEDLYDITLEAEDLSNNRPSSHIENEEDEERLEEWRQAFDKACNDLWAKLAISEDKDPRALVFLVNITKGKKLVPRMVRFLSPDQMLNFITALLSGLEETNVCKNGVCPPKGQLAPHLIEEVELFLTTICPPILNYVNEAPLIIVNGLLGLLIEKNNVAWVSRSKAGLAFLTLFLTRIEMLRQSGGSMVGMMAPSPDIPLAQSVELYKNLFSCLQNHFLAIFPPTSSQIEDVYVWQFLAALAVGLNVTQQHQLVIEVREKVLENVTNASRGHVAAEIAQAKIANVNLFLHALGLDASQVNVTSTPR